MSELKAPARARRIGLLGGSFDPVHNAHVALAYAALQGLGLDSVRWVPAGRPWQKDRTLTNAAQREAMVRLAMAGEPRFQLDRIEMVLANAGTSRPIELILDAVTDVEAAPVAQVARAHRVIPAVLLA